MRTKRLQIMLEIALCGALGIIFEFFTLFTLPQGGAISLTMLPIFLLAFRRGVRVGLLGGLVLAVLQLMFRFYYVHPLQLFLDYFVAFVGLGFAGVFSHVIKKSFVNREGKRGELFILLGTFLGSVFRLLGAFLAGIIFYGQFAPEGTPVWIYSLTYNGAYIGVSFVITAVVLMIIIPMSPRLIAIK